MKQRYKVLVRGVEWGYILAYNFDDAWEQAVLVVDAVGTDVVEVRRA